MTVRCLCSRCRGEIYWTTTPEDYVDHINHELDKALQRHPAGQQLRLWDEAPA